MNTAWLIFGGFTACIAVLVAAIWAMIIGLVIYRLTLAWRLWKAAQVTPSPSIVEMWEDVTFPRLGPSTSLRRERSGERSGRSPGKREE